jgi:hypothetical protein
MVEERIDLVGNPCREAGYAEDARSADGNFRVGITGILPMEMSHGQVPLKPQESLQLTVA